MDIAAQFGDNLVRARKSADMSQDELSVRASVHRTEISQLERGLRVARIDTLVKISGGLEVDPGDLLAGIVWTPGRCAARAVQGTGQWLRESASGTRRAAARARGGVATATPAMRHGSSRSATGKRSARPFVNGAKRNPGGVKRWPLSAKEGSPLRPLSGAPCMRSWSSSSPA
jgi:transcriptional regulator with XRE-family HTH domain